MGENLVPMDGLPARLRDMPSAAPATEPFVENDGSAYAFTAASLNRRVLDRSTGQLPTQQATEDHYAAEFRRR